MVYYEEDEDYHPYNEHEARVSELLRRADSLQGEGKVYDAFDALQEAVFLAQTHFKPDSEIRLVAQDEFAFINRQMGRCQVAEEFHRIVLTNRRKILETIEAEAAAGTGPPLDQLHDPYPYTDVAMALNAVGLDLKAQGRFDEGLTFQVEALDIFQEHLSEDSREITTGRNNLACSYYQVGRYAEAVQLHELVLEKRRAGLGEGHPETLAAMDMLGMDYMALDATAERAVAIQEQAVAAARKHLGPAHPTTIKCSINLANTYGEDKQPEKAIAALSDLYEEARPKDEVPGELNEEDYDSLTIGLMNALGVAYLLANRAAEAEPVLERCYVWNKTVLGPKHPHTEASLTNLESAWVGTGRLAKAEIFPSDVLMGHRGEE